MRATLTKLLLLTATTAAISAPPVRGAAGITAADYNRFALKAQRHGLWSEAEFRLRQALALAPDDPRLHNNLAVALEAQGKLDEAYKEYKTAQELDPRNPIYRRNLRDFVKAHRWEFGDGDGGPLSSEDKP